MTQISPSQSILGQKSSESSEVLSQEEFWKMVAKSIIGKHIQVLRLVLKRLPFEATRAKDKNVEYRRRTPYWTRRIVDSVTGKYKCFDYVECNLGYQKARPQCIRECMGICVVSDVKRRYKNGLILSRQEYPFKRKGYYGIRMGNVIHS